MKSYIQSLLQRILGYENYLFCFSIFSVYRNRFLNWDSDFLFFLKLINKTDGGVILDVGANIGATSTFLAMNNPNCTVFSYEPIQANFNNISKVLKYFDVKNVTSTKIAVGEHEGIVELITPSENGAKKQGLSHVVDVTQIGSTLITETAAIMPLDNLLNVLGSSKVTAIKIDVENHEIFVLKGAKKLLLHHRPIVFAELWDNERKSECILLMESLGYETRVHVNNKLVPYVNKKSNDYFFIPHELSLTHKISI